MKIAAIDVYQYDLRYAHGTYVMSDGREVKKLPSTVVRVRSDDGVEGWGEACPLGATYLPSFAGGVQAALAELGPALIGVDPSNIGRVRERMNATMLGQQAAKSPVDIACFDLFGRSVGVSVTTLLGGRRTDEFALYIAIPLGTPQAMADYARARYSEGIRRFQLKLGGDPHEDVQRTRAVLAATPPDTLVVADANCGWRRHDAVVAARLLDGEDRVLFEQPCPTMDECLAVRERTTLPLVLDELIVDLPTLVAACRTGGLDAINLKIGRVGGLSPARIMRDACEQLGLRMTIEDTWGGDLASAAVSHLAASTETRALLNVSFFNDWTLDHIAGHQPRSKNGRGRAPDGPGLGVDVDVERLGAPLMRFS